MFSSLLKLWRVIIGFIVGSTILVMVVFTGTYHRHTVFMQKMRHHVLDNALEKPLETDGNYSYDKYHLKRACAETHHIRHINYRQRKTRQIFKSKMFKFAVCVVPKSGCTFMKQLVYYLNDPRDWERSDISLKLQTADEFIRRKESIQNRIFDIPRMDVHHEINFLPFQLTLKEFIRNEGLKVVHSRNPYSRLYSAYIDKFFIPARWNIQIDLYIKKLSLKQAIHPGHINACDAKFETFEDFLESVILMAEHGAYDVHWGPISELCSPCRVQPDIVIRQENYQKDVQYLLKTLGVSGDKLQTINAAMAKQGVQTDRYLYGLIKTMFTKGLDISGDICFTKIEIAQRVWQALKIQGQLYQSVPFPYRKFIRNTNFDADFVASVILSEIKTIPITGEESRSQRERALARAYRNIRPEIIIQIQGLYYHDFMTFGYDFRPPSVA